MHYTLYIDESGDFERREKTWVVGGLLLASDSQRDPESRLNNQLARLSNIGKQDLHLTELRSTNSPSEVNRLVRRYFDAALSCHEESRLVATVNSTGFSIKDRERNYRLMLIDLIQFISQKVAFDSECDSLRLVIAQRTIKGVRQSSSDSLKQDLTRSVTTALETDLINRGLLNYFKSKLELEIVYANDCWGTIVADFVCNTLFRGQVGKEKSFISSLKEDGLLLTRTSYSNVLTRRAYATLMEGHISLGIYRLLMAREEKDAVFDVVRDCFSKANLQRSSISLASLFDELLDYLNIGMKQSELSLIEGRDWALMCSLAYSQSTSSKPTIQLRLDTYALKLLNHIGDGSFEAVEVLARIDVSIESISREPRSLAVLFDAFPGIVEYNLNTMDSEAALDVAEKYFRMAEEYEELVSIVCGESSKPSNELVRAKMTYGRSLMHCNDESTVKEALRVLREVNVDELDEFTRSRLRCYLSQCFSKLGDYEQGFKVVECEIDLSKQFETLWLLRNLNDLNLTRVCRDERVIIPDDLLQSIRVSYSEKNGHPFDLIHREMALAYALRRQASDSLKLIKKAFRISNSEGAIGANIEESIRFLKQVIESKVLIEDVAEDILSARKGWAY